MSTPLLAADATDLQAFSRRRAQYRLSLGSASAPFGIGLIASYASGRGAVMTIRERVYVDALDAGSNLYMDAAARAVQSVALEEVRPIGASRALIGIPRPSAIPVGVGLKTSSAFTTALVMALAAATHTRLDVGSVMDRSTNVQHRCGLTSAGSVDDTWASVLGGIVIAETGTRCLLVRRPPPMGIHLVVMVPHDPSPSAHRIDRSKAMHPYVRRVERLLDRLADGEIFDPTTEAAFLHSRVFGYSPAPLTIALATGAFGVALSGKGPARAAFSDESGCVRIAAAWRQSCPSATLFHTVPCADGAAPTSTARATDPGVRS